MCSCFGVSFGFAGELLHLILWCVTLAGLVVGLNVAILGMHDER